MNDEAVDLLQSMLTQLKDFDRSLKDKSMFGGEYQKQYKSFTYLVEDITVDILSVVDMINNGRNLKSVAGALNRVCTTIGGINALSTRLRALDASMVNLADSLAEFYKRCDKVLATMQVDMLDGVYDGDADASLLASAPRRPQMNAQPTRVVYRQRRYEKLLSVPEATLKMVKNDSELARLMDKFCV